MKIRTVLLSFLLMTLFFPSQNLYGQEQTEEESVFRPTPARPSDIQRILENAEDDEEQDIDSEAETTEENLQPITEEEAEDNGGLTDYPNLIYTAFIIPEDEVEAFLEFMDTHEDIIDQIGVEEIDSEEYDGQAFIARYKDSASKDKQPILFSAHTQYEAEEEAIDFGDETLTLYPDLFFDYEVYEVEGLYDVLFGIRVEADTTLIWYDENEEMIQYNGIRPDFTYTFAEDEENPYQDVIEERFPNQFEFTSDTNEEGITQVTMTHANSPYDETEDDILSEVNSEEDESSDEEENSNNLSENDNNINDDQEASSTAQNVEQSNTGLLGFRDNVLSFLNDRNISSNHALLYLAGGFVLLVGLLLLVVGKR